MRSSCTPALELGTENVYKVVDFHASTRMAPETASALWDGGFKDIWSPQEQGLSAMLQNWYNANFEMVQWFIDKGVSPYQRHRDGNFGALHLYARRIAYPGAYFQFQMENIPNSPHLIPHLYDLEANRDDCRCLCSPAGCSPVTFVVRDSEEYWGHGTFETFSAWVKKTSLLEDNEVLWDTYAHDMVRILAFEFLSSKCPDLCHTCCSIDQLGGVESDSSRERGNHYRKRRLYPGSVSTGPHRKHSTGLLPSTNCEELLNQIMEMYDEWQADFQKSLFLCLGIL